jgi:TRAP-type mannitol/chloroaromatic compound transport system substrate-binding protein
MEQMERRDFLKKTSLATLVGGVTLLAGCGSQQQTEQKQGENQQKKVEAPAVQTKKTYEWKMVTTWPPHFPVLGEGADNLAKWIGELTEGRLKIQVYGGGELVPALETFDAVSQGVAQMSHGAAYYWAGKLPSSQFFAAVPFGMNAQQMNAWFYNGGGLGLWEEIYASFNLVPMPAGNTGVQMGGWFNREINTIDDFKGLKMRIPGLGGKVIAKAGGSAILSPGGEIYTNLERGVIDATEWIGPYHDFLMGFHKVAKYYYYPGWHEPGTATELIINKGAFESLPKDLQHIIRTVAYQANLQILSEFESQNNKYLQTLINEHKIKLAQFPDEVLSALRKYAQEVIDEITSQDPLSKKVYESYSQFRKNVSSWAKVSEKSYYSIISG